MAREIKAVLIALVVALSLVAPVAAGPLEDGMTAFDRGDYAEAVKWYRKAADQGLAEAQFTLGVMYHDGLGESQDDAEALKWFRKGADQGDAPAQINLGLKYHEGRGVPQDYVQAHMWFNLAASRLPPGEDRDMVVGNRDSVAARMTPAQVAEAQRLARE
ncbi:MAG: tetratricopeptide repeat protein [Alphaproteobacteria bacterium]